MSRYRETLERYEPARDATLEGAPIAGYEYASRHSAMVREIPLQQQVAPGRDSPVTHAVEIRGPDPFNRESRAIYRGRVMTIVSTRHLDTRRKRLEVLLRELGQ